MLNLVADDLRSSSAVVDGRGYDVLAAMLKIAPVEYVNLLIWAGAHLAVGLGVRADGIVVSLPKHYLQIVVSIYHTQYIGQTYNSDAR